MYIMYKKSYFFKSVHSLMALQKNVRRIHYTQIGKIERNYVNECQMEEKSCLVYSRMFYVHDKVLKEFV